jgi:hypothetical protein
MSAAGRAKRNYFDTYQTPKEAITVFLPKLTIKKTSSAFEPCLGNKHIASLLPSATLYYCELEEGVSYLSGKSFPVVDLIITNPPYTYAQEFLTVSLKHCLGVVAYLLRINFLGTQKRRFWWQDKLPSHLYVLSNRPSFTATGGTDATEYAWFVWDFKNSAEVYCNDPPGIYVL